jgi:hypothetical protein
MDSTKTEVTKSPLGKVSLSQREYILILLGLILGGILSTSLLHYLKPEFLQEKKAETPVVVNNEDEKEGDTKTDEELDAETSIPTDDDNPEQVEYPAFDIDKIKFTEQEFSMSYWSNTEPLGEYSIMLPVGAKIYIGDGVMGGGGSFIYTDTSGAETKISINYPHFGSNDNYLNYTKVEQSAIPNLYRVNEQISERLGQQWMMAGYTNEISINTKCKGLEGELSIEPPCGVDTINFVLNKVAHPIIPSAYTNNKDFSIADKIVGSLKVLKIY